MNLQERRTIVDGGPDAELATPESVSRRRGPSPHKSHAQAGWSGRRYVRGRNAERAPKPLAGDDMAQHNSGARGRAPRLHVASFERAPDRRRRNHVGLLSGAVFDLGDDIDGEAVPGPVSAKADVPERPCRNGNPIQPQRRRRRASRRGARRQTLPRSTTSAASKERVTIPKPRGSRKLRLHLRRRQAKSDRAVGKIVGRVRLEWRSAFGVPRSRASARARAMTA